MSSYIMSVCTRDVLDFLKQKEERLIRGIFGKVAS